MEAERSLTRAGESFEREAANGKENTKAERSRPTDGRLPRVSREMVRLYKEVLGVGPPRRTRSSQGPTP